MTSVRTRQLPPRPPVVRAWSHAQRVLAVRLDSAGDVLMTTPALRALRARSEHLTLLTSPSGTEVARLLPEVDDIIVHEAAWMKPAREGSSPDDERDLIERVRAESFDAAVIFTVDSQSALPAAMVLYLAGVPRRLAHVRENPYGLLTDWVPDPESDTPIRHEVQRQIDLLGAVGIEVDDTHLSLHVPDAATRRIRARLRDLGVGAGGRRGWLLVHPGATAPARRYPPDCFGHAIRLIHDRTGWMPILTGDESEVPLVEAVRASAGGLGQSLAGKLSFAELAAIVGAAPMLITNNTGPAHIAAALGTPVVDLYALTNLQHTPWRVPSRVLSVDVPCRGCLRSVCPLVHNRCLRGVEPSDIADAVIDLAREVGLSIAARAAPATLFG